jgi:xanthine dehydrogenase accessory factor
MASVPRASADTTLAGPLYPAVRGGLSGLLEMLLDARAPGAGCVLGIVFATAGSTYQKPGALILLDRMGIRHGALSGGCLEPEVEERARRVSDNRCAEVIDFDTRGDEDLLFGSGTGCRGRIHLLLLPQPPDAPLTEALERLATSAGPLELALVVEGPATGSGSASLNGATWHWGRDGQRAPLPIPGPNREPMSGTTAGRTSSPTSRPIFRENSRSMPRSSAVQSDVLLTRVSVNPPPRSNVAESEQLLARVRVNPPPRILLFGAGPETSALFQFAQRLGWSVSLVEHRGRWLKFAHSAGVRDIIEAAPDDAAVLWRGQHATAAVAMTHNYALDMKHLRECADSELSYIGLLGPAARRDQMLAELGEEYAKRLGGRLHAPVGLALGGRGPEPLQLHFARRL